MNQNKHYDENSSKQNLNIEKVDFQIHRFQEIKLSSYQEYFPQNNPFFEQEEIRSQIQKAQVRQRERHKFRIYHGRNRA